MTGGGLADRETGQFHDRAAFEGALMRTKPDTCPVRALLRIWERIALFHQSRDEFVHQVRMGSAVPTTLHEAEVRGLLIQIVDAFRREGLDRLGQPLRVIGSFNQLRNLMLRELGPVHDQRLMLNQRPFHGRLVAIDVDAFAILPRGVEERTDNPGAEVGTGKLDVRSLDRKGAAVILGQLGANRA